MEFDENKAVDFINSRLGDRKYPSDELLNVIDMMYDYYEQNGMLDPDNDDDDTEDIEKELTEYVVKMLRRDKLAKIDVADVPAIVKAEFDYEDSLDDI
ncbi:MAG: hypothetical protein K2K76_09135 [Muribaculaceae bacterium]|nr:hypothetical protein [Muribaculaceae bacterium]